MLKAASTLLPAPFPYGAPELKDVQPRTMLMSVFLSSVVVQAAAWLLTSWLAPHNVVDPGPPGRRDTIEWRYVPLPPPLESRIQREPIKSGLVPKFGTPVPVEDPRIDTTAPFPSVAELESPGLDEGIGPGTVILPEGPIMAEAPPATFVPHEVPPAVAVRVDPIYPPVAIRAELEGNVFVRVWVDRQGKVRSAEVIKSDGEVFDASALDAVRQWVFTPARMQDRPVSVWVTIPIRFRLAAR